MKNTPAILNDRIQIFTTGGTIDKVYFDSPGEYQVGVPQISAVLERSNVRAAYQVEIIFQKDSLTLTTEDRELIRNQVLATPLRKIIITHGTDTMVETAKHLEGIADKTIVLTGALQPARFIESDAAFNIGAAFAAVATLTPGVYIAMSGEIFPASNVRKNKQDNCFEMLN